MEECGLLPPNCRSIIKWLDFAINQAAEDTSYLWRFGTYITNTWTERNDRKFRGRFTQRPTPLLLRQLHLEIEAFPNLESGERIIRVTRRAKLRVQRWIDTWIRERTSSGTQEVENTEDYLQRSSQQSADTIHEEDSITSSESSGESSPRLGPTLHSMIREACELQLHDMNTTRKGDIEHSAQEARADKSSSVKTE
ncbi:hypothetical protein R1sor_002820 [Riccia sorocarpa]|uniref:Uncharacterized protein n=1 Tax=Riccia sorocarpa TaxID=122646 RepID=A0ABD3GZU6_9MARC